MSQDLECSPFPLFIYLFYFIWAGPEYAHSFVLKCVEGKDKKQIKMFDHKKKNKENMKVLKVIGNNEVKDGMGLYV